MTYERVSITDERVTVTLGNVALGISGNEVGWISIGTGDEDTVDGNERGAQMVRCYGDPRDYDTFEGFLRWVGQEYLGAEMSVLSDGFGRIVHLFDQRPYEERTGDDEDDERDPIGGNFGYGVNLDIPDFSEWGHMSQFPLRGQTMAELQQDYADRMKALEEMFGPVVNIDGPRVIGSTFRG